MNNLEGCEGSKAALFSHSAPQSTACLEKKTEKTWGDRAKWNFFLFQLYAFSISPPVLPLPTQPAGKVSKGDQVVAVLVQEGEGAVGQRVGVLVGDIGPRHQQPVQAFKLRSVQPILPFYKGAIRVTVVPRCCLCRRRCAAVPPVQSDEVLRLQGGGGQRKTKWFKVSFAHQLVCQQGRKITLKRS